MLAPLFDILESISPWWWVAFGVVLAAIEMLTFSFFLIWPAAAAIVMAILIALIPGMPGEVQISLFAALSVGLTWIGRTLVRNYGDGGEVQSHPINERSAQLIGRKAKIVRFEDGEGTVEIDGIPWRARGETTADVGETVFITQSDGTILTISDQIAETKEAG